MEKRKYMECIHQNKNMYNFKILLIQMQQEEMLMNG